MNIKKARMKARKEGMQGNAWIGMPAIIRVCICIAIGTVAAVVVGSRISWEYAPLVLWDVTAVFLLLSSWLSLRAFDGKQTEQHAQAEDPGRGAANIILLLASIASLVAVGVLMVESSSAGASAQIFSVGLGVVSIVLSWAVVHCVYMLRYADLYFKDKKGIDFNGNTAPTYADFAYIAFTIGMTYQVSDTALISSEIRRVALAHALLSYVFGTAIIAATINFVVGLAKS